MSSFQQECLLAHNEYRRKHNVPPLQLNMQLCSYAQQWADHLARTTVMQHRSPNSYGENLYSFSSSDPHYVPRGKDAVDLWYSEIRHHMFGMEPGTMATGHFTQVVWKDSTELGVGMQRNGRGQIFVVCNYNPPGNFIGRYSQSVPPVGGF